MYTYDNFLGRIRSLENCKQHGSFCCFEVQGPAQDGEVNIPHPPSKPAIAHVPHGTALQRFRFRVKEMEGSSWATYWDDPDATGMNNGLSYLRLTAAQKAQVQNGTYDGRSAFLDYANWYQHAAFDQYSALEESKASAEARKGVCISFSLEWILRILYHRESNLTRLNKVKGQLKRVEARQVRFVNPIYDARDNQMHHDLALAAEVVVCRCRQCLARQADERKLLDNKYYAGLRQV